MDPHILAESEDPENVKLTTWEVHNVIMVIFRDIIKYLNFFPTNK